METFDKVVDYLVRVLRIVGAACLVGMMMIPCLDVVLRAAFNRPIFGTVDIVQFLAVITLACAMPYTHQQGGHVGVDLVVRRLSTRKQHIIDAITSLVSTVLFALVTWQMWEYAQELQIKKQVSMALQIPVYPFIYFVSICFGILSLVILLSTMRLIGKAVKE